jgi:hypothetical protein
MCYIDHEKIVWFSATLLLLEVLSTYKINFIIERFSGITMQNSLTNINLRIDQNTIRTNPIKIQRRMFQDDSLSALRLCWAINPLSNPLNESGPGYQIKSPTAEKYTICHLLYMDYLKAYA